jgi:VanZ family protein
LEGDKEKAGKKRFGEWKVKALIKNWLLVMIWMGGIYWGSSQPALPGPLSSPSSGGFLLRNILHFTEYAALAVLLWRASVSACPAREEATQGQINHTFLSTVLLRHWSFPLTFAMALLYAVFDEWHQSFVPNRAARPLDIGVDMLGVIAALGVICWRSAK